MKKKVYLPRWQRYYVLPIMLGVWGLITYIEFFTESDDKLGTVGYIIISGVLLLVTVMTWLMTSGRLPAYIIDEGDKGD